MLAAGNPSSAQADEIDDVRKQVMKMYDDLEPQYQKSAEQTHAAAQGYVRHLITKTREEYLDSFNVTLAAQRKYFNEAYQGLITLSSPDCTGNSNSCGISDVLSPFINAEPIEETARRQYIKDHYSDAEIIRFTSAIIQLQKTYSRFTPSLRKTLNTIEAFDELKRQPFPICRELALSANYDVFLANQPWRKINRLRIPKDFFQNFPGLVIHAGAECQSATGCEATPFSLEGQQRQTKEADQWTELRNAAPLLAGAVTSVALQMGALGPAFVGAGPAGAVAAAVVAVVATVITLYKAFEEHKQEERIDDLNRDIRSRERKLEAIFRGGMINREQFAQLKARECTDGDDASFQASITAAANEFDAIANREKASWFFSESDRLFNWYNSLYLIMTKVGADGKSLMSQALKDRVAQANRQFWEEIYRADAVATESNMSTEAERLKNEISTLSCRNLSPRAAKKVHDSLISKVEDFESYCREVMDVVSIRTVPFMFREREKESTFKCVYSAFDKKVGRVEVVPGEGFKSDFKIFDQDQRLLADLKGIDHTQTYRFAEAVPGLTCDSPDGEFGTRAETALKAGSYELARPINVIGLGEALGDNLIAKLKSTSTAVRTKLLQCKRQLGQGDFNVDLEFQSCAINANGLD